MSLVRRAQQWGTLSSIWHLYDMKWQDPFLSAPLLVKYLKGLYKPIYHPMNRCGDHVVVINSKHIALRGDDWTKRVYFHHTTYHGGATWTLAWELHKKNKKLIVEKAVYHTMKGNLQRRATMARLLIFEDDNVPKSILANISNQIKPLREVPTNIDDIPQEKIENFPRVIKYPEDHILR
ncbi:39S ribosomal protein L13, mitochondrial [Chelonus insularis]|uniref:39S ribosomal protein L13, mitochondrial n=1 Tax=Chelonus insularis TaxID=460826 RepID=UPI00158A277E|nr:39S ribosomal protein L13, mitochondrial [Chelonus insularis]